MVSHAQYDYVVSPVANSHMISHDIYSIWCHMVIYGHMRLYVTFGHMVSHVTLQHMVTHRFKLSHVLQNKSLSHAVICCPISHVQSDPWSYGVTGHLK